MREWENRVTDAPTENFAQGRLFCMTETRRTWVLQFSLRTILIVMTVLAVIAFVAGQGQRGAAWAAGLSIGLLGVAVSFAVFALMFLLVRFIVQFLYTRKVDRGLAEPQTSKAIGADRIA